MKKVLIPLPAYGFDPTEVAIPWKVLHSKNVQVQFATPHGETGKADERMLLGKDLGIWKSLLQARKDAVEAYAEMQQQQAFRAPLSYAELQAEDFDGLVLPGGHDKGVKDYLESVTLQNLVAAFFENRQPVGAICHGVVLAARSKDAFQKPVLRGYNTTCLLEAQELLAYRLTRLWLGDYYLTYPGLTVEREVRSILEKESQFQKGPQPLFRDAPGHMSRGFALRDRNYVSARWPGDAYNFSALFLEVLQGR
ncbi:MAG: type 1 glutamine amidotransferase domain-containing protein [Chitinophagales bacterium]